MGRPGSRRTFVVQIHADGTATVENLATRERVPIAISVLGDQIEAWLAREDARSPRRNPESKADELRGKQ